MWPSTERMQNLISTMDNSSIFPEVLVKRGKKRQTSCQMIQFEYLLCMSLCELQSGEHQDSNPHELCSLAGAAGGNRGDLHGPALSNNTQAFASGAVIKH